MSVADRWHTKKPRIVERIDKDTGETIKEPVKPCRQHKMFPAVEHGVGARWQVRWRDEVGEQQSRNFEKKTGDDEDTCADAFDARIRREAKTGTLVNHKAGKTPLAAYAKAWRKTQLHRDSTAERMERVFRLHIDPILGHVPIGQVRASHIRAWVKDRAEELAPSTLAVVYSNLAGLFASAVIDRDIGMSPCIGISLPDVEKHGHFIPTPDQVHMLAAGLGPRRRAVAYVGAGCGLRSGEIFGLELDGVDFLRREIDISQQLVCNVGRPPFLGPPKTKTSTRTVELPEVTAVALAEHIKAYPPLEFEIDDLTNPRRPTRRIAKLLFTTNMLNPMYRGSFSKIWRPAREAAGMPDGVGLHCLRHYFATLLIHQGASVKTVQLALGHSTPTITLNEYVGEWPDNKERTRTIVDSALGLVPSMCPPKIGNVGGGQVRG
jgi:integrase